MNRFHAPCRRLAARFTPECLAAFGSAFFGCHVWLARCWGTPNSHSAFATILPPNDTHHPETLWLIILPLLAGAALQLVGLRWHRRAAIMLGTLLEFFVFSTALISCCMGNPWGTGVGAYTFLTSYPALLFLYRSLHIEWIAAP